MDRLAKLPRGIWAIGSDLTGGEQAEAWATVAQPCAALTLRRPVGSGAARLAAARALRLRTPFLATHGHGDLARAVGADAILTGVRSLPLEAYAKAFPELLRGASCHDRDEAQQAIDQGAEFLIFGPVWETPEKQGILEPRGLEALHAITELGPPVLAIGGIETADAVRACLQAGVHGCAILRAARHTTSVRELVAATT